MNYKIGDSLEVITAETAYKGKAMPNSTKDIIFLKLDSGYNIGINKNKIKKIKLIKEEHQESKEEKSLKIEHKKGLPTIAILHTGGTIASRVDYKTGAVISSFKPEELLDLFPEISEIANIKSIFISNMFSENMSFEDYTKIAKAAINEIKPGTKGIIIGHGTDTLTYTAAALSFMFENLPIPIILVGAQRSSDRGSSDASMNIVCAIEFINKTDFSGVAICMHDSESDDHCIILPATKTRKMHTSRRDAFKAINDKPIAKINYSNRIIEMIKHVGHNITKNLVLKPKMENKVGIIKAYPNINPNIIKSFKGYKGLIIEGTGLGHISISVFNEIKKLIKSGCIVVMASQCIFGRVNMNVYSTGRNLQDIGVISADDMLAETAYIKLAWLLANYKKNQVIELMHSNLRYEMKERILPEEFLTRKDINKIAD